MGRGILLYLCLLAPGFAFASDLPYLDKDFTCIEKKDAETFIEEFNIDTSSFGGLELCSSNVDTKKLLNDLVIVREGQFKGDAKNSFIKNFIPRDNYYPWLKSMTYGVRRGHDVPYATAYNSGGYFTMQDGWAKLSTLGRVGTIIHEARHTEGYSHTYCSQGPYLDSRVSGCDTSLDAGGSHGVEMEYYARVSEQGTNFHPVYKSMARLMLLARSNFVFNRPAMKDVDTVFAATEQDGYIVDDGVLKTVGFEHKDDMVLKRTSSGAVWFGHDQALAFDFYAEQENFQLLEDDYSYFKMLKMNTRPKDLIDMEEFDVAGRRYLVAMDKNNKLYTYHFGVGNWSRAMTIPGAEAAFLTSVAPTGAKGLFIVLEDKTVLPFDPEEEVIDPALNKKWDPEVNSLVFLNGELLSLGNDGIVKKQKDGSKVPMFEKVTVKQIVNVPVYDVF